MNMLHLLIIAKARRVIEPRIRVIIIHTIDVPRTERRKIRHNRDIDSPSLIGTGRTLIGRPASGLAGHRKKRVISRA